MSTEIQKRAPGEKFAAFNWIKYKFGIAISQVTKK